MSGAKPPVACEGYAVDEATDIGYHVHCPGCDWSASLRERLATAEAERDGMREDIAAYLLDRADQYATRDWRWNPLSGAARDIMGGAVDEALSHGELQEPELRRRVRNWRKK